MLLLLVPEACWRKHWSTVPDYLCSPFVFPAPCLAISPLECLLPLLSLSSPSSELYLMTPQLSFKAKFPAAPWSRLSILPRIPHILLCETARWMLAQMHTLRTNHGLGFKESVRNTKTSELQIFLLRSPHLWISLSLAGLKIPGLRKLCLINLYIP